MASAQIIPDITLQRNSVVRDDGKTILILGGTKAEANLFHSFQKFDLLENRIANFDNNETVLNIFVRVTGGKSSRIDGLIRARNSANLFLINPKGIIFGPHAQIDLGGSFLTTTSEEILFEDGFIFGTSHPDSSPSLLTISRPIGLLFNEDPGSIINQSKTGLSVRTGRTLSFIGGKVILDGGNLSSPAGRIELGSVGGNSHVSLDQSDSTPHIMRLNYDGVNNYQDIHISNLAIVDISGNGSGDAILNGKKVILEKGGRVQSLTLGANDGGKITVTASESLDLIGNTSLNSPLDQRFARTGFLIPQKTSLFTSTFGSGRSASIEINTGRLNLEQGADITAATDGLGAGGDVLIRATDSVVVSGVNRSNFSPSQISTGALGSGNSGKLDIKTVNLLVHEEGQISAPTSGSGNGGRILVKADSIEVSSGGQLSTTTLGLGNAGSIDISASKSVNVLGSKSGLFADTLGKGAGGSVSVFTDKFFISDEAVIDTRNTADGIGGSIFVESSDFTASQGGQLVTTTEGIQSAGNITLQVLDDLTLKGRGSGLFANTTSGSTGPGGNIVIDSRILLIHEQAGIVIDSQGLGPSGNIKLQTENLILARNAFISAESATGQGGNIDLSITNVLLLQGRSNITATAGQIRGSSTGGNIKITAPYIIANSDKNNNIRANAFTGTGGNITLNVEGNFPTQDLVELPANVLDPSSLNTQTCTNEVTTGSDLSGFIVTERRGGVPLSPNDALGQNSVSTHWIANESRAKPVNQSAVRTKLQARASTLNELPDQIIEAQGLIRRSDGKFVLSTHLPKASLQQSEKPQQNCQQS